MDTVVVGARGSHLAQAMVREFLARLTGCPVVRFKNRPVMTDGDKDRKSPLAEVGGGTGAFSSLLEGELLAGTIDIAVHSLKDLPTAITPGLSLAVTPPREDIHDALCGSTLEDLRPGARVGTSSVRRIAQLKAIRPDVEVVPIRGNVPARLARTKTGLDAVVVASAGIYRLGRQDQITQLLPLETFPPSPGQGALGIQVRTADAELLAMLNSYGDPVAESAVRAERTLLARLHGGCSVPVGAYAVPTKSGLSLTAQVTSPDGTMQVTRTMVGTDPETLGDQVAESLIANGAEEILREVRTPVS